VKGRILSWEGSEREESRAAGWGLGCAVSSCPSCSVAIGAAEELSSALRACDAEWIVTGGREFILQQTTSSERESCSREQGS